jgi:hypothetical protein
MQPSPAVSATTINQLIPGVALMLQDRSDINQYNPQFFMQQAIQELNAQPDMPFEELRVTGPQVSLNNNPPTYSYPVTFFLNPGDDYAMIDALNMFVNYPANTVPVPLKYETPAGIRPMTFIPGFPSRWCRYGRNIWVGNPPNLPYVCFADYRRRHPFNTDLGSTVVLLPNEWFEVVQYATAYRMAQGPLRWSDMAKEIKMLLYGDPNDPSQPGLIKSLKVQAQLDTAIHSRRINVRVGR